MKFRDDLLLVLLLVSACRPGPEPAPVPGDTARPREPEPEVKPERREPASEREPEPKPERPGWTAAIEGSPCELACAEVYACLLDQGREASAAATIELGCLDACERAPQAFASCERPGTMSNETCASYLDCAREAWPGGERSPTVIDPSSDGCGLACEAFARCEGATLDEAEECVRLCREKLDDELERRAGECAQLDSCSAIESCVLAIPGA